MGTKGVGRPRDGNPEQTRQGILRAAERSFASAGFVGATTRQVAASASVNVATLHYHFGNKEGLYRAVLREARGGELVPPPACEGTDETFRRAVRSLFEHTASRRSLPRLALLNRLAGPPAKDGASLPADPRVAFMTGAVEALRRGGAENAQAGATEAAARWIVGMVDVSFLCTENADGEAPGPEIRDAIADAALGVLRTSPALPPT